jgi:hypothetical protein
VPGFFYILILYVIGKYVFADPRATLFDFLGYKLSWVEMLMVAAAIMAMAEQIKVAKPGINNTRERGQLSQVRVSADQPQPTVTNAGRGFYHNTEQYLVPPDHYSFLGDNRDNSTDSRAMTMVGHIPSANLVGPIYRSTCATRERSSAPLRKGDEQIAMKRCRPARRHDQAPIRRVRKGRLLLENDGAPLIQPNQVERVLAEVDPIVAIGSSVF